MNSNKRSRRFLTTLLISAALLILPGIFFSGCGTSRMETGGAYAQTNTVPDLQFYQADAAYDLAYFSVDAIFKFEFDNRDMLWKLSPDIKHTLDKIRPQAWDANVAYLKARDTYKANPVPANLTAVQTALAKMQQLAATAKTVIPQTK